jgi:hypothetical protein
MRVKIWDVEEKSGGTRSDADLSVCGPSGVGGTNAIVGGCGAGLSVAGAGIVTVGIGGLENVKGRALMGGSSRLDDGSGV